VSEGNGTPPAGRDDGAARDTRPPKPCLRRIAGPAGQYGFCSLPDGHDKPDQNGQVLSATCSGKLSEPPPPTSFGPKKR
jgi:hypothetical protein